MIKILNDLGLWFFNLPRSDRIFYMIMAIWIFAILGILTNLLINKIKKKEVRV